MHNENGLSLIELMIVVAIIGIIAALAIPRFQIFQAKARQAEARNNLNAIYTLQKSFYGDNDRYGSVPIIGASYSGGTGGATINCNRSNDLGFSLTDCKKVRYSYRVEPSRFDITDSGGYVYWTRVSDLGFRASAYSGFGVNNKVFPGCEAIDIWQIDQNKSLINRETEDGWDYFSDEGTIVALQVCQS